MRLNARRHTTAEAHEAGGRTQMNRQLTLVLGVVWQLRCRGGGQVRCSSDEGQDERLKSRNFAN